MIRGPLRLGKPLRVKFSEGKIVGKTASRDISERNRLAGAALGPEVNRQGFLSRFIHTALESF